MSFSEWIIHRTDAHIMLYLTCTMISSIDLARYWVYRVTDLDIRGCGTITWSYFDVVF